MKTTSVSSLLILAWMWSFAAWSGVKKPSEDLDLKLLLKKAGSFDRLSVELLKERTSSINPDKKSMKLRGQASFEKPNLFRWALGKQIVYVSDGTDVYQLEATDKVATKLPKGIQTFSDIESIIEIILDSESILTRLDILGFTRENGKVLLLLKKKETSDDLRFEAVFNESSAVLERISLLHKNNKTVFHFLNPSHNPIPKSTFTVPEDYKVTTQKM